MVMKGEKPKLPPHLKVTWLPTFIQKCWQTKAQDRPTFETICTNLQQRMVMKTKVQKKK
jgi:hypothetical protein